MKREFYKHRRLNFVSGWKSKADVDRELSFEEAAQKEGQKKLMELLEME